VSALRGSIPSRRIAALLVAGLALAPAPGAAVAADLEIESRVGEGAWRRVRAVDARAGEVVHNVAGLTRALPVVRSTRVAKGVPAVPLRWGRDVARGDLVAVKYDGWGQFGHIGALYADGNGNGLLDGPDLVLHAGPSPLRFSSLDEGMFDGEVKILRPGPAPRR
jgi:hypothetical protein